MVPACPANERMVKGVSTIRDEEGLVTLAEAA